jgi:hypothetical protein
MKQAATALRVEVVSVAIRRWPPPHLDRHGPRNRWCVLPASCLLPETRDLTISHSGNKVGEKSFWLRSAGELAVNECGLHSAFEVLTVGTRQTLISFSAVLEALCEPSQGIRPHSEPLCSLPNP